MAAPQKLEWEKDLHEGGMSRVLNTITVAIPELFCRDPSVDDQGNAGHQDDDIFLYTKMMCRDFRCVAPIKVDKSCAVKIPS